MRHGHAGKKLGRDSAHRKALYSNLAGALIQHGRIKTTEAKAKAVKPYAEKMVTLGKRGDLHARRLAMAGSSTWRRGSPSGTAATRGSSSWGRGRATMRRWCCSSSSTTTPLPPPDPGRQRLLREAPAGASPRSGR